MVKLSGFIIGTIIGSLFITIMALFIADAYTEFAPTDYDNSSLETLNKIQELKNQSEQIKDSTLTIEQDPTVLDVIGGFFKSGYNSLKTAAGSISVFNDMAQTSAETLPLGDGSSTIYDAVITIVFILIFVGVFLAAILKWYI